MSVSPSTRRRAELVLIPLLAALSMALIIGAIVVDRDSGTCPSANWHNHVSLTLSGDQAEYARVSTITACEGSKCVPLAPTFAKKTSDSSILLSHQGDGSWILNVGSKPPASLTFSAFDSSGNLLAQQSSALNWTRVGGSEQCGGPMDSMKVLLQVP